MREGLAPRVLLIDSGLATAGRIRAILAHPFDGLFVLETVDQLSSGLERVKSGNFAAVLLSLSLVERSGIEAFDQILAAAPHLPILILGNIAQQEMAIQAVAHGAYDYLLESHLDNYCLPRALHHAIERKAAQDELYAERES
jgi:DNA-binding NtrC family response regulator